MRRAIDGVDSRLSWGFMGKQIRDGGRLATGKSPVVGPCQAIHSLAAKSKKRRQYGPHAALDPHWATSVTIRAVAAIRLKSTSSRWSDITDRIEDAPNADLPFSRAAMPLHTAMAADVGRRAADTGTAQGLQTGRADSTGIMAVYAEIGQGRGRGAPRRLGNSDYLGNQFVRSPDITALSWWTAADMGAARARPAFGSTRMTDDVVALLDRLNIQKADM